MRNEHMSDDSWSACSTISCDTYRASIGEWSYDNQIKIDAVWQARADVDTARAARDTAEQILVEATERVKHAMQGLPTLKARLMPPRAVNIAKANQLRAKRNADMARQLLKHRESVLDRKREEASKLGIDVRPVPELIGVPLTFTARGA